MPGQPKKWAVIEALEALAREEDLEDGDGGPVSALDYVCAYIETGARLKVLREKVADRVGFDFTEEFFSRLIRSKAIGPNARERIAQARKDAAPQLAERARDAIEDAPTDSREQLDKAKETAKILLWHAERLGRETYGQQQPSTNVNLFNVGEAHLQAFQAINARSAQSPVAEIPAPIPQPAQLTEGKGPPPADGEAA